MNVVKHESEYPTCPSTTGETVTRKDAISGAREFSGDEFIINLLFAFYLHLFPKFKGCLVSIGRINNSIFTCQIRLATRGN